MKKEIEFEKLKMTNELEIIKLNMTKEIEFAKLKSLKLNNIIFESLKLIVSIFAVWAFLVFSVKLSNALLGIKVTNIFSDLLLLISKEISLFSKKYIDKLPFIT